VGHAVSEATPIATLLFIAFSLACYWTIITLLSQRKERKLRKERKERFGGRVVLENDLTRK
jgi:hypothetical protein